MNMSKYGKPAPPEDLFRGIGFDTSLFFDGYRETIFFYIGDGTSYRRYENVSEEAIHNFIEYWSNQIQVAKDYLANHSNPNTHEWKQ